MKTPKVRTEWASASPAKDGSVVVCAKGNGSPRCMWFESLEKLKQAIDGKRMTARKWAVAVPRSSCILKPLTLPASEPAEAVRMIEFELPSLVPLSVDEIVYGSTVLNKQDNMLSLLVCILKLSTLDEHLEPFRTIGIEPLRIALSSLAVQNWFNTAGPAASGSAINALVDTEGCIVQTSLEGNFQEGSELITSNEGVSAFMGDISHEILHQREQLPVSTKDAAKVFLAGDPQYASRLKDLLTSVEGASQPAPEVCVLAHPRVIDFDSGDELECRNHGPITQAVVATGLLDLAVGSRLPYSNLLPQQYAKKYQHRAMLISHVITASFSISLILLVWVYLVAANWRIGKACSTIESQIAPIKDIASSVDSKHQRVKVIQRQLSNRGQIARLIEELYKYTPKSISISQLTFTSKKSGALLEIRGQANELPTVFEYMEAVRDASLLSKLDPPDADLIPRPGGSVAIFKARCNIKYE